MRTISLNSAEGSDFEQVDPNPTQIFFDATNQNDLMCVPVTIINDMVVEDTESFYAVISDPGINLPTFTLDPNMARITIEDDDSPISGFNHYVYTLSST